MYWCKKCKCAVCSRWARTRVCAWGCNVHLQARRCSRTRALLPRSSLSSGPALLRYEALVAMCSGVASEPYILPFWGPPLSIWSVNIKPASTH